LAVEPELLCMDEAFSALDVLTGETLRNEVIDLYTRKTSPVNTILMVTHSISEAVFMATRIVVMGAHPGTIRAVLDNPLPYPRDEHQPEFVMLSQKLHALVTQTVIPEEPAPAAAAGARRPVIQSIPTASLAATIGLLEVLENEGAMELFELARHVDLEFTQLLLVVKAAETSASVPGVLAVMSLARHRHRFVAASSRDAIPATKPRKNLTCARRYRNSRRRASSTSTRKPNGRSKCNAPEIILRIAALPMGWRQTAESPARCRLQF